uniref:Dynein associated protein domain-containing protein n=1 Tax=Meloidogyne incognita TaxID=6306 RepID=A0A914M9L6_MELIC
MTEQLNFEAIINNLTNKNVDLEEQIKTLKLDVHELEQLHQMDEEIIEMQKETEKELTAKNQELALTIATMNTQISELESRIEVQMSSDAIIADLTSKNLDLEEQYRQLKADFNELEQLHLMEDEIIDTQKETEKELLQGNEEQMLIIATLKRQLLESEDRAIDYEHAINKFRQKTTELKERVQNLEDDLSTMRAFDDEKARAAGAEISLMANVKRDFSELVEAQLNFIELESAKRNISYLRSFIPDKFMKAGGDNDCLILCVLLPRLSSKALCLSQLLFQKYPQPPDGLKREHVTISHKGEQWAHVRHFGYQLQKLNTVLQKFVAVFKHCSFNDRLSDPLSRLAVQQTEICQREQKLEDYFKLLKQNKFDENTSIDMLEQMIKYFERIFSANLSTEPFSAKQDLQHTLAQIKKALIWIRFNGQRLQYFFLDSSTTSDSQSSPTSLTSSSLMTKSSINNNGNGGTDNVEFISFVDQVNQLLEDCDKMTMRAMNRIPKENELLLPNELNDQICMAVATLEKCGCIINQICSMATSELGTVDTEALPSQQMLDFVFSSVEKFVGQIDGQKRACAQIFELLESVKAVLQGLGESLENSSMEICPNENSNQFLNNDVFPPLVNRAQLRKKDIVEADSLRWQLSKKDDELLKLQSTLKSREESASIIKIRLDMAEKKLVENEAGTALKAEIQQLKTKCEQLSNDLEQKKSDYELKLTQLQSELADTRAERDKATELTREFSKKALFANLKNQQQITSTPKQQQKIVVADDQNLSVIEENLRTPLASINNNNTLGRMDDEIRRLNALEKKKLLLNEPNVCTICGKKNNEHQELQNLLKESDTLMTEFNRLLLPSNANSTSMINYLKSKENIEFKIESLRLHFVQFWQKYRSLEPQPTFLWPLPDKIKQTCDFNNQDLILEEWGKLLDREEERFNENVKILKF